MANTPAICTSFKAEILQGIHNFNAGQTLKIALYFQSQSVFLGATTTVYSATGEVTGTNYTAGGLAVPNATPIQSSGTTVYWSPSANVQWTNITVGSPFDCALVYNATQGNRAIMVLTFPAVTANQSNFTIGMPANTSTAALLQEN